MSTNDFWTLQLEDLGMKGTGDALASQILTCRPPYAICVQGKWGSGKTSLMRYAMARLGGEPLTTVLETSNEKTSELPSDLEVQWAERGKDAEVFLRKQLKAQFLTPPRDLNARIQVVPIWFNPWQHQDAPIPVVALLHELRQQFSFLLKFSDKALKLSQVAVESGLSMINKMIDSLSALQGGPKLGLDTSRIRQIGEAYEQRRFETIHDAQRINLLFREAVGRLLRREKDDDSFPDGKDGSPVALRRLVIFIDDLDRCAESQTVRLLEAIKLYLQTPHCVFVFGMDASAARRAVRAELRQGDEVAREYLEKLFQTTLHVPLPVGRESFVASQLKKLRLGETDDERKAWAKDIVALVEPNPRKMKNFLNSLAACWQVTPPKDPEGYQPFLLAAYLRAYHPDVFRLVSYAPGQVQGLHRVLSEQGVGSQVSPADYFLNNAFRHAFSRIAGFGDDGPKRGDSDAVVTELTDRLDRHRSDTAFLKLWMNTYGELGEAEAEASLRPYLRPGEAAHV